MITLSFSASYEKPFNKQSATKFLRQLRIVFTSQKKKQKERNKQTNRILPPSPRPHFKLSGMSLPTCSLNSGTTSLRGGGGGKSCIFFSFEVVSLDGP